MKTRILTILLICLVASCARVRLIREVREAKVLFSQIQGAELKSVVVMQCKPVRLTIIFERNDKPIDTVAFLRKTHIEVEGSE